MSYKVTLRPSGREFEVERDESVLDAALREGIGIAYGCRNGTCLSCRARLVEGEFEYRHGRPEALDGAELDPSWALLCQALPKSNLVAEIEEFSAAAELSIATLPARVARKEQVAHDVMVLELKLPEGERLDFLPGQYVDILLRDGRRRSFSLASAPRSDGTLSLHIRRVEGGEFSSYVFEHLKERALMRLRGPLGGFFLRENSSAPIVFLAGGTGFAPIKSIIESAFSSPVDRDVYLYWGVRAERDLYMHELAQRWADSSPRYRYVPVLSEPDAQDGWSGRTGFVHEAVLEDFASLEDFVVYSCGPPVMIDAAWQTFAAKGLSPENHYSDAFEFAYETGANTL